MDGWMDGWMDGIQRLTLPVCGSKIAVSIPKNGTVAEPGLVSMAPGKGVTTMEPVSVCLAERHVSVVFSGCEKRKMRK